MSGIDNFPDDNNLWLVKWIDQIRLAHLTTNSASFSVLIQKLSISDPKLIHRLGRKQLQGILSPPSSDQKYEVIRLLIGVLPEIEIGAVFQAKNKVAQLPSTSLNITLPLAELSCESRELLELLPSPYKEWPPEMPYRVLNRFEYHVEKRECQGSNCLVFKTDTVDYIIPRSVIFKTFYAQNVKFAKAFTNGDWPTQRETLVCMKELESGLKTGIDEETGEWNIVLRLKVPYELTPLLGVYIFDEYGKKCASSIYASMFKARNNNPNESWFMDAKIPFSTTPKNPLTFSVQGFELKKYTLAEEGTPSRFLVTKITRSSLPSLPAISCAYVINGQQGRDQVEVDEPAPFSSQAYVKPANALTTVDSNTDSNPTFGATEILSSSFSWINPPAVRRMQKASSKSYNKPIKAINSDNKDTDQVSPGNNTYSASARPEAQIKTLIRQPDKRFEYLLAVLNSLKNELKILDYKIVAPLQKLQGIEIGGVSCWNFLDEDSRSTGNWPKKGWRMQKHAEKTAEGGFKLGQPRAALVVRIEFTESEFGHWIEIEQKSTSYRSPYIRKAPSDSHELIQHLIEVIARTEAKKLTHNLLKATAEFDLTDTPVIKAYKHGYVKNTNGDLSQTSVFTFLKKCHESSYKL